MKAILLDLKCPSCHTTTHVKSEMMINPVFEPELKEKLMDRAYFKQECPLCHTQIHFLHPLIYYDPVHHHMSLLEIDNDDESMLPHVNEEVIYYQHIVKKENDLIEKIRIHEDGLQDEIIQQLKKRLYLHYELKHRMIHEIHYHDIDRTSDTIWFTLLDEEGIQDDAALSCSYYRALKNQS